MDNTLKVVRKKFIDFKREEMGWPLQTSPRSEVLDRLKE
jgi:hypothetical protein